MLSINNLQVAIGDKEVINNVSLKIGFGEIHALMGPNGSGKSTLAMTIAGHPAYSVTSGQINIDNVDYLALTPNERAVAGVFLTFQHPIAVPGVTVQQVAKMVAEKLRETKPTIREIRDEIAKYQELLAIKPDLIGRSIHDGFSGGEKKRIEMLLLLMAKPKLAIIDEIDSGLDVDAVQMVARAVLYAKETFKTSALIITHYQRLFNYLKPDFVHVLSKGKIIASGGMEIIEQIENNGFKNLGNE